MNTILYLQVGNWYVWYVPKKWMLYGVWTGYAKVERDSEAA